MKHFLFQRWALGLTAGVATAAPAGDPEQAMDIRDIRGPVEIPELQSWQPWILAALATLLGLAIIWYLVRSAKRRWAARVLSARECALGELERAKGLMDPSASREYAYAVSDTLRVFMEIRFNLPTTRQTTDEFLQAVAQGGNALGPYEATLHDFLGLCDRGKFGKWKLLSVEMEALHGSAMAVVNAELDQLPPRKNATQSVPAEAECAGAPA